ncbi:MAG: M48 family metallopeptidase [Spirochaetales bacterium]|nr:M48 family metallopeptidase [Spirochaetales bacterium]
MTSECISNFYILLLMAMWFTDNGLTFLNIQYLKKKKLPHAIGTLYTREELSKAKNYSVEKGIISIIRTTIVVVTIVVIIKSGFLGSVQQFLSGLSGFTDLQRILYVFLIGVVFSVLDTGFDLYMSFSVEKRYGFSTITPITWIKDKVLSIILSLLISAVLLFVLFRFLSAADEAWWLYSFAAVTVFQALVLFVYPVWIAPLFNKFSRLEEGELRQRLAALADTATFPISDIYVMDASKRSTHSNAYFAGFGRNKRIVLFDTLVHQLSTEEIEAVVAHEIGHAKKKHVWIMSIASMILLLFVLKAADVLLHYAPLYRAFSFDSPDYAGLIVLLLFFSAPLFFFLTPLFSVFSRRFEYQADAFAYKTTGTVTHLKSALSKLAVKNLSNLMPHPWYSFFHYTHPTLLERFRFADTFQADMLTGQDT